MKPLALILLAGMLAGVPALAGTGFVPGEVVEYKISWLGIPLAWSKMTTDTITENGRELVRLRMEAQTYAPYKHIYEVDDATEVIADPETGLPLRLDVVVNEGSIHKSHYTEFDHANRTAHHIDRISNTTNAVPIKSDTNDMITFMYAARSTELPALANEIHEIYVDGKVYELGIELRDEKKIKLDKYDKVECIQVEPLAEFDGLFIRQGKIFFWISKQNRRMVTCITARVPVGNITAKLETVEGPGNDFWARNKEEP